MDILFFDLNMGAAGDMLTAALFELLNDEKKKEFLEKINAAGIPDVQVVAEQAVKCGITGTHMKVLIKGEEEGEHHHEHDHHHDHDHEHHHHHHASLEQIENIINNQIGRAHV